MLDLLHRAYYGLRDWPELIKLLPELKKYKVLSAEALAELEREVYVGQLTTAVGNGDDLPADQLRQAWQKMPAQSEAGSVVAAYLCGAAGQFGAEQCCRESDPESVAEDTVGIQPWCASTG